LKNSPFIDIKKPSIVLGFLFVLCYFKDITENNKMKILKFKNFSKLDSELEHFISTRVGGFSKEPFSDLNLALHVGDEQTVVLRNRKQLAKNLQIPLENFVFAKQTHSENIFVVTRENCSSGVFEQVGAIKNVDAFITKEKNIAIAVLVADCVPILLFDKEQKVIAVIHAGWQGTLKEIAKKTVEKMLIEFNCEPKNIIAGVGPSIGPCHFEVQEDVFSQFEKTFGIENKALTKEQGKLFIDLWSLNKEQLLSAGIPKENIEVMGRCTVCENKDFFSARKEKITGRFMVGIMLK
jgi:polyphenol oxidase